MNKKLFIIAGNHRQYLYWINQLKLDKNKTIYLHSIEQCYGIKEADYILVGEWWEEEENLILSNPQFKIFEFNNKKVKNGEIDTYKKSNS